jgi:signal transduction histidine kinase
VTVAAAVVFGIAAVLAAVFLVSAVERSLVADIREADQARLVELQRQLDEGELDPTGFGEDRPPVFTLDEQGRPVPPPRGEVAGGPFVYIDDHPRREGTGPAHPPSQLVPDNYELSQVTVPGDDGPLLLAAATPLDDVDSSVATVTRFLWVALPLLVAVVAALAWFITGRALRPVGAMTSRVRQISGTTLHERVPTPRSSDEIAELAHTMNDMLERLEQAALRQREFVSDASHELRTPAAVIRTEVEVALAHPEAADWESVARNVLAEDERLEALIADLLTLARTDEHTGTGDLREVDLDDVVLAEASRTRRLPVDVNGVHPARVRGRESELRRMIGHLLDNAARHADSVVSVAVDAAGGTCVLTVDDDGTGIAPDDRDRVFERFSRLSAGRERDAGGAGLGLAVVRRIAERHGGMAAVGDSDLGGAQVTIRLPSLSA